MLGTGIFLVSGDDRNTCFRKEKTQGCMKNFSYPCVLLYDIDVLQISGEGVEDFIFFFIQFGIVKFEQI